MEQALVSVDRLQRGRPTSDLERDLGRVVAGDICFDPASRAMYAHDSSNYRQMPVGIVRPKTVADVEATLAVCRQYQAAVVGRGGGTSLAGQTCNHAVVIDFSRYMDRVLSIDPERKTARVQPGVILDVLRDQAAEHGLTFGPDPSTHDRCTLGGMIGNNSCGVHAVMSEFYGPGPRTEDQVRSLDIITPQGVRMTVGETTDEDYRAIVAEGGERARIYQQLRALRDRYADRIRQAFPDIPRRVSGYNLPALLPENGFNVARALVGSESTCATVLEAEVELCPSFPARCLVVIGYPDVYRAGDHIAQIREYRPVGCEGIDQNLTDLMRRKNLHVADLDLLPEGGGWLLVEFGGQDAGEARARAQDLVDAIASEDDVHVRVVEDPEHQSRLWAVRESGLGATAFVPGMPDTWPGWEDSAVPPNDVGPYLRDLRQLMAKHGYSASVYGHFAQGCIHCRINFDLGSAEGIERYRLFTREAAELVVRYGGSLSGEHGDGQARADLLPIMFGDDIMDALHQFKAIWDPEQRMNPGKVIDARHRTEDLKQSSYHPFDADTYFRYPNDGGDFSHAAVRCVGVGKCRRQGGGVMCPSYMVTHEEKHSTRGRARLLYEMLQGDMVEKRWHNQQVFEALDLCLACKGCVSDCPVEVDMATYKAEFLAHYYRGNLRPRHAYSFGWIHRWARLAAVAPNLANWASQVGGGKMAKWMAGISQKRQLPRFARHTFRKQFSRRKSTGNGAVRQPVILWPDTFNNHFHPETLMATAEVLEQAGFEVRIPRQKLCCGRALYDFGMLDLAVELWRKTLRSLGPDIDAGIPVVGAEPSCVAALRDELVNLFPDSERATRLAAQTYTLSEALSELAEGYRPPTLGRQAVVQPHCHHRSIMGFDYDQELISAMDIEVTSQPSGCCGMAGAFGFEADKYDVSIAIADREIVPAVRGSANDTLLIADGFSCREQIRQCTGREAVHLAEALCMAYDRREARQLHR